LLLSHLAGYEFGTRWVPGLALATAAITLVSGLDYVLRYGVRAWRRTGEGRMSWTDPKRWQAMALVLVLGVLTWLLAPILTPFVISALLRLARRPLVDRLERSGPSRATSVGLVFALITLLLALAVAGAGADVVDQVMHLIDSLPRIAAWITGNAVPWLEARLRVPIAPLRGRRLPADAGCRATGRKRAAPRPSCGQFRSRGWPCSRWSPTWRWCRC
jgi:hypothetical protein